MTNLRDREWQSIYESKPEQVRAHLVKDFYEPALERSQQYDRIAGYFSSTALAAAANGIHALVENDGEMRLIVGTELYESDRPVLETLTDRLEGKSRGPGRRTLGCEPPHFGASPSAKAESTSKSPILALPLTIGRFSIRKSDSSTIAMATRFRSRAASTRLSAAGLATTSGSKFIGRGFLNRRTTSPATRRPSSDCGVMSTPSSKCMTSRGDRRGHHRLESSRYRERSPGSDPDCERYSSADGARQSEHHSGWTALARWARTGRGSEHDHAVASSTSRLGHTRQYVSTELLAV